MQSLPIDESLPEILEALRRERRLVLQAPPGTGKSTRVPAAVLNSLPGVSGQVVVTEPRRIAARLLASRVSSELGQRLGRLVGYRVRFEDVGGPETRLYYVTSGVLLRRFLQDPKLTGVDCVVIDEFHERHLDSDLVLAFALRAQETVRPNLTIIVMSATLQGERIKYMMGACPYIHFEHQIHPLTIEHAKQADDRPLEKQVASAVRSLLRQCATGDILVFLPGAGEIRRASEALLPIATEYCLDVMPLHGDMPLSKQASVLQPNERRKVILATNVAESSITVPGVVGVVDSGLARTVTCSPWSGLPTLELQNVSRASAVQRAGRAGRTSAGTVRRLYTRADFESRAAFETPEILRMDLCEALLLTHGAGVSSVSELKFIDPPPPARLLAAEQLLSSLSALSADGGLTDLGRQMIRLPVHPRLARLVIETHRRGIAELGCLTAALLAEKDLRFDSRARFSNSNSLIDVQIGDSDVEELIEVFEVAKSCKFEVAACTRERIDSRTARVVAESQRQLLRCLHDKPILEPSEAAWEQELAKALLLAFPDRVAWRRESEKRELVMVNGNVAKLGDLCVVRNAPYLLALVADERVGRGRKGAATIRVACRIDPNWLVELLGDQLVADEQYEWADPPGRVESRSTIRYGAVVLDESRAAARPGPAVAEFLAITAQGRGVLLDDVLSTLKERLRMLVELGLLPAKALLEDADTKIALEQLCADRVDLKGIDGSAVVTHLIRNAPQETARALRELVPESWRLAGGRSVTVHYEPGRDPWIASRLQDFFGMSETPSICAGRRALTLHLLAPNQRAVQVTQDLVGFWDRHYPTIRRELMRRYPRHQWPADGRNATAPPGPRTR